jgi:hypothetical protein
MAKLQHTCWGPFDTLARGGWLSLLHLLAIEIIEVTAPEIMRAGAQSICFSQFSCVRDAVQILASRQISSKAWRILIPSWVPEDVVIGSRRAVHVGTSIAKPSFFDVEMIKGASRGSDSSLVRLGAKVGLLCSTDDVEISDDGNSRDI